MAEGGQARLGADTWARIACLLVVAFGAAAGGFLLVTTCGGGRLAGGPSTAREAREPDGRAEDGGGAASDEGEAEDAAPSTPRVTLGEPFYHRCWSEGEADAGSVEGDRCGRLPPLERYVASRISLAERCRDQSSRPVAEGSLSLGVELDFASGRLRTWSGPSSTLENAQEVATCIRRGLDAEVTEAWPHRFARYRVFFTFRFGEEVEAAAADAGAPTRLKLDRVRLRERPEKGRILARLREGELVYELEHEGGWVRIRTADGREGWVFEPAITGETE